MGFPFDHIAPTYNSVFTKTVIGQLQRKIVWRYLENIMPQLRGYEMLELNSGTNEDAELFGEYGSNMLATDVGTEMFKLTARKSEQYSMQHNISSHYIDVDAFDETVFDKKFDLVFSNFGGLNCINPESMQKLLKKLPSVLNPGGRFIGVVMPKFCAWETVFFLVRFRFKKAFRRFSSEKVLTNTHETDPGKWFYHPSQIKSWSVDKFRLMALRPVGFMLPPSHLEPIFGFRKRLLKILNRFEKKVKASSYLSGMADHFIIDLKLR
jgi:ubiquinone/menaquinone biosynthesis C-methylase UbiE